MKDNNGLSYSALKYIFVKATRYDYSFDNSIRPGFLALI